LIGVSEFFVDACKADVGDVVKQAELFHDELAKLSAFDFVLVALAKGCLDGVDKAFYFFGFDRALLAGAKKAFEDFLAAKRLASPVAFDNDDVAHFGALIRGKAAGAFDAFAPSADAFLVRREPAVKDFVVGSLTKRADHGLTFFSFLSKNAPKTQDIVFLVRTIYKKLNFYLNILCYQPIGLAIIFH